MIEIKEIRVIGGEFRILSPEDRGLAPTESASLIVSCQYGVVTNKGCILGTGAIGNSSADSELVLSDDTLTAFHKFFKYLNADITKALGTQGTQEGWEDEEGLEGIVARSMARKD